MLVKRSCSVSDKDFVYNTMKNGMHDYFARNTKEGWSDDKFDAGFRPERITIIEQNGQPIGFYDVQEVLGEKPYLYVRNVQIVEGKRGHPFELNNLIDDEARIRGLSVIMGKVFKDNSRTLGFLRLLGYSIVEDASLSAEENSVYVEKRLSPPDSPRSSAG